MKPNIIAGYANIIRMKEKSMRKLYVLFFMLNEIPHKMNDWQYNDKNCTNMIAI